MSRRLSLILLALLWASPAWAVPARVQLASNYMGASAPHNQLTSDNTFSSPTTSGNTIVVLVSDYYDGTTAGAGGGPWTVSDNKGNTYTSIVHDGSGSFGGVEVFYAYNITGGSGHVVTVTAAGSTFAETTAIEYSGLTTTDPLDVSQHSGYVTAASTFTSGNTASTAQASELAVGVVHYFSATVTATGDTGWTIINTVVQPDNSDSQAVGERILSSAGAYAFSGSFSATPSFSTTTVVVTFKAAAGGGGGGTVPRLALLGVGGW